MVQLPRAVGITATRYCGCRPSCSWRTASLPRDGSGRMPWMPTWAQWVRCCCRAGWSSPMANLARAICSKQTIWAAAVGSIIFIPCSNGMMQAQVGPGIRLKPGWKAPHLVAGSPVVGGHTVYNLDFHDGILYAFTMDTGAVIARTPVGQASRFATPALAGSYIFVGTFTGISAVMES